jgi:hypothetical protein
MICATGAQSTSKQKGDLRAAFQMFANCEYYLKKKNSLGVCLGLGAQA